MAQDEAAAVPVVYASVEDVRGSFADFIERRVDASAAVWRCGMCKVVLPEGFHIAGSAQRAKRLIFEKGGVTVRRGIRGSNTYTYTPVSQYGHRVRMREPHALYNMHTVREYAPVMIE